MNKLNAIMVRMLHYQSFAVLGLTYMTILPFFAMVYRLTHKEKTGWQVWTLPEQTLEAARKQ